MSLIISISYLYALYGLRVSVGVLRVHRRKYSHMIAFNLCALNSAAMHGQISKKDTRRSAPGFHRRSMAEDQDTQTGAAVYPAIVQYAGNPQQISANDQHATGQSPE